MKVREFVLLNLVLPLAEKLQGTCASKWYKQIVKMQTWSSDEVQDWQIEKMHQFINHAYEHTVYYRNLFDSLKLTPDDIQTPEDLKKLPVLSKDDIRSHYQELIADDANKYKHREGKTGGSTGEPLQYICDEEVWGYITGTRIFSWRTTPYRYGDKFVALGSEELF